MLIKKQLLLPLSIAAALSCSAQADVFALKGGIDYWYADAKINSLKADDAKSQYSAYLAFEHFIPLLPNAKVRYTNVKATGVAGIANITATEFDQIDWIAYYELFDNDMMSFDVGINLQHFNGKFAGRSFSEWQPNLYADGRINIPAMPLALFATFSAGTLDDSSTADAEAGALFNVNLGMLELNLKAGYRIMDHDFSYFAPASATIRNQGFFLGGEIHI
ncbi:MAG: TIGR04219 family outer membrane beta-barrel protein [Enterovibrio sp.]